MLNETVTFFVFLIPIVFYSIFAVTCIAVAEFRKNMLALRLFENNLIALGTVSAVAYNTYGYRSFGFNQTIDFSNKSDIAKIVALTIIIVCNIASNMLIVKRWKRLDNKNDRQWSTLRGNDYD